jgi:lysine/ornithine N-monooxygenase
MVAVSDEHDDDCPRCQLRSALETHLVEAATGTEQQWHDAASGLVSMLVVASSAITTMRARWCDKRLVDVMHKGAGAAEALVALLHALDQLQEQLVNGDDTAPDQW